jgi:diguanylate cyclase (GGDEF)-like protein
MAIRALAELFEGIGGSAIISAREHGLEVVRTRSGVIQGRVRTIAFAFAFLTIGWIALDALAFEREVWMALAPGRLAASVAFAAIAVRKADTHSYRAALCGVAALFTVPCCFLAYSVGILAGAGQSSFSVLVAMAYAYLPFVVVTGLAIFPLTLRENAALGGALLAAFAVISTFTEAPGASAPDVGIGSTALPWNIEVLSLLWPVTLVTVVASIAGMGQLQFLIAATRETAHDRLTEAYTRRFGEQVLEYLFGVAVRNDAPLTLLFVDLDHFKRVNDEFGHEAGDAVLRAAGRRLGAALRRQDLLVRWGGEEFLVVMPNTTAEQASFLITRLAGKGFDRRPDRSPQTASLGFAERTRDMAASLSELVAVADRRMYAAKAAGRNRTLGPDGLVRPFIEADPERGLAFSSGGGDPRPQAA